MLDRLTEEEKQSYKVNVDYVIIRQIRQNRGSLGKIIHSGKPADEFLFDPVKCVYNYLSPKLDKTRSVIPSLRRTFCCPGK